jgi:DNA topoisomerase-2
MVEMTPWYKGFRGSITPDGHGTGKFITKGCWCLQTNETTTRLSITELPIGRWTSDYKEFLDTMLSNNQIKAYTNNSSDTAVDFRVEMNKISSPSEGSSDDIVVEKTFKLTSNLNITNMHLFDERGTLRRYTSPLDIVREFVKVRLVFYRKRKRHVLRALEEEFNTVREKQRFVELVLNDEVVVFRRSITDINAQLTRHKFRKEAHDALLGIKIHAFTQDYVEQLARKVSDLQGKIRDLRATTETDMFVNDIDRIQIV